MHKRFFDILDSIDSILCAGVPYVSADELTQLLQLPTALDYFCRTAVDPCWLSVLESASMLVYKNVSGSPYEYWPVATYLHKIAAVAPGAVARVIQDNCYVQNPSVLEQLAECSMQLPIDYVQDILPVLIKWTHLPDNRFLLQKKIAKLAVVLVTRGRLDEGLALAQSVLSIRTVEAQETTAKRAAHALVPYCELWVYKSIVEEDIPLIVIPAGIRGLRALSDVLNSVLKHYTATLYNEEVDNYVFHLRPAIEECEHNLSHDSLDDILIKGVRDTAEAILTRNIEPAHSVLALFEQQPYRTFTRIGLYLLWRHGKQTMDLVERHLSKGAYMYNLSLQHEYRLLLEKYFSLLTKELQGLLLNMIGDTTAFCEYHRHSYVDVSNEVIHEHCEVWQLKMLTLINEHLSMNWQTRRAYLSNKYGEPECPTFDVYYTSGTGPKAPKDVSQIEAMTDDTLFGYLETWEPGSEFMAPSLEGLGRELSSVVANSPERFVKCLEKIRSVPVTYLRAVLDGLREALRAGKKFDWTPILDLCEWVVKQSDATINTPKKAGDDKDWSCTRSAISQLIEDGLTKSSGIMSIQYRLSVWRIIAELTEDPQPSPEYERLYCGKIMDPPTLAVNTVRGKAFHSMMRYALWVYDEYMKREKRKQENAPTFEIMPEVRKKLDQHLDENVEPSQAIRSIYGKYFPWLALIDPQWAKYNSERIFPTSVKDYALWDAAWNTYVVFCSPYDNVFKMLMDFYRLAIERTEKTVNTKIVVTNPGERLAEHLMLFYLRGKIVLHGEDGLLDLFWQKAPDALCQSALEDVGRMLYKEKRTLDPEVEKRARVLWEYRVAQQRNNTQDHKASKELTGFGMWFASNHFDHEWKIRQLREALASAQSIVNPMTVIEALVEYANTDPAEAVECLDLMLKIPEHQLMLHGWDRHLMPMLRILMENLDFTISQHAEDLVHFLGSLGRFNYRELLQKKQRH